MPKGLTVVIRCGKDDRLVAAARGNGYDTASTFGGCVGALIVRAGTAVPWELVGAGFAFLKAWDAAVPLWRYGVLAKDLGTGRERDLTEGLTLDLRVPVYACELLFVSGRGDGPALVEAWGAELKRGDDERLAFLRAVARVKPRLCVLPTSWMRGAAERAAKDERARRGMAMGARAMVRVEVAPGRFVRCRAGDEERVRAQFASRARRVPGGG